MFTHKYYLPFPPASTTSAASEVRAAPTLDESEEAGLDTLTGRDACAGHTLKTCRLCEARSQDVIHVSDTHLRDVTAVLGTLTERDTAASEMRAAPTADQPEEADVSSHPVWW